MTGIPLLFLILPALCMAGVHSPTPGSSCPGRICVCGVGERSTTRNQRQEANCTEMPSQKLSRSITKLRVNGEITTVTKKMIATLGGDLQSLDLSDCGIQSIETGSFDEAPKLIRLKLSNNRIEEIGPGMFKKNKVLRELYLDGNMLKHVDESAFSKLEQLRELYLERNFLTQFPTKIPIGLTKLNISHNNIGPALASDMHETNLKALDLCANPLEKLTNITLHALNKLQYLCLGDKAVPFPKNAATFLPHIADLMLVASVNSNAVLDPVTQAEVGGMETLTSLTIVNYKFETTSFLHGLTKLRHLKLQGISTPREIDFQNIFMSKTSLNVLNLEGSQDLAHILLDKMQVLGEMNHLQIISFRNTNITHLNYFDIPHTDHVQLDISKNPLLCNCRFAWLQNKNQNQQKGGQHILMNEADTICAAPRQYEGKLLMEVVDNLRCPPQYNHEPSVPSKLHNDSYTDPNGIWHWTNGHNKPDYTDQEADGNTNPDQNVEQTNENGDGQQPAYTDMPDIEIYTNQEKEDGVTTEPKATSQIGEWDVPEKGGEIEHNTQPATEEDGHNVPNSMPVDDTHEDGYSILYIVLGCLLALLILVGIILAIFYWHFKKTGSNKITPESGETTAPSSTPAAPTYQQLQHTEGSSLLKNVKK